MTGKTELLKIKLKGGSPWGFRLQGGLGTGLPLTVAKVRRKSKAYNNLKEGDVIVTINDVPCTSLTYEQVMSIADKSGNEITIEVERKGSRNENAFTEIRSSTTSTIPEPLSFKTPLTATEMKLKTEQIKVSEKENVEPINQSRIELTTSTASTVTTNTVDKLMKDLTNTQIILTNDLSENKCFSVSKSDSLDTKVITKDHLFEDNTPPKSELADINSICKPNSSITSSELEFRLHDTTFINEINSTDNNSAEKDKPLYTTTILKENESTNDNVSLKIEENSNVSKLESQINNHFETPLTISDHIIQKTSETTETGEKQQKLETEKFHEKTENEETTFIKTDFEENIKTCSSPSFPFKNESAENKTSNKDTTTNKVTSEKFESFKCEKTEITKTTKIETHTDLPFQDKSNSLFKTNNTDNSTLKNLPSLDTDIITSLNIENYTSSSDMNDSMVSTRKKKMFSSSSFYEEPKAIYPTVEEQFEMAKKIAESLADDTNKKSKGANMFFKRAMRAPKWIHEGPEPSTESFVETSEISHKHSSSYASTGKKLPALKLVLDPRHAIDLASLRSTGQNISEHNAVSPDICHDLIRDLQSPSGKGSAMFAKRKKKSAEWVVDEEKVKSMMKTQEQELSQMKQNCGPIFKQDTYSPWNNYGKSTGTVSKVISPSVHPDKLAETVMKAADSKRRDSIQSLQEEPLYETCLSPIIPATPAASYYDIYRARPPKGWPGSGNVTPSLDVDYSHLLHQNADYDDRRSLTTLPHSSHSFPKKYNFQNFNTVPRKWTSKR